jgi:hypothetical protein
MTPSISAAPGHAKQQRGEQAGERPGDRHADGEEPDHDQARAALQLAQVQPDPLSKRIRVRHEAPSHRAG